MLEQPLLFNDIASTLSFNSSDFSEHSQSGQICTLKRYIFKIDLPPPPLPSPPLPKRKLFLIKIHFSKYLPQKIHFQNVFLKKFNFAALIKSESESSEELSKSSLICLTTFFLIYLHYFEKTCG